MASGVPSLPGIVKFQEFPVVFTVSCFEGNPPCNESKSSTYVGHPRLLRGGGVSPLDIFEAAMENFYNRLYLRLSRKQLFSLIKETVQCTRTLLC